tara:strand:- start:1779 stop:2960 length:1182 start_codon:yes stop_codon:yes gene_type:complete
LRVGINCLGIKPNYVGGVTSFTLGLLDGLLKIKTNNYQIYLSQNHFELFEKISHQDNVEIIICEKNMELKKIMFSFSLLFFPKKLHLTFTKFLFSNLSSIIDSKSDLIYTPTPTLFYYNNNRPSLVSMHDIQHLHYPRYFSFLRYKHRKKNYLLTAQFATYLQASSSFIKYDFLNHYKFLEEENIFFINEGVNQIEFQMDKSKAKQICKDLDINNDFLFYPAQLWHHKDHLTVLKALKILRDDFGILINLVLTGEKFSATNSIFNYIKDYNLNEQIIYLGKVSFESLVALYKMSKFFITATLYESSSLPLLEAISAGTAVIASDTPPNKEMGQFLDINFFRAKDELSLVKIINKIWKDDIKRNEQISNNNKNIKKYLWDNIALKYNETFNLIV